ncbi:MAG TPA: class I SAM-dependent methyltransferase [Pirellulaceae bacterium]|nr:class I SAM-dependent methyltransferase [Pirellulaceae bacterium]
MTDTIAANIYDYPTYYDLIFGSDWRAEFGFLSTCFDTYATGQVKRLFEPACGTGRLLYRFSKAGYSVCGLDLNERAVAFCNQRLRKQGFPETAFVADMSDFTLKHKVDAAFNTINSFRHLLSEKQATAHLRCVAAALRKGGIYVLGFHLTPTAGVTTDNESWSAQRGQLCVNTRMWTTSRDLKLREERCAMTFDVHTPTKYLQLQDEIVFRTYTAPQLKALLKRVPELDLIAIHDFAYDTDDEVPITSETEDVVLILRKK